MSILNVHPVQNAAPLFQLSPHTLQQTCAILSLYIVRSFFCPSLPLCTGPLRWCSDGETWSGFHASFCENNGQTADSEQPDPPLPKKRWLSGVCLRAPMCTGEQQQRRETKMLRQTDTRTISILFKYLSFPHKAAAGPNGNTQWHQAFSKSFHSMEVNWRQHVHIYPPNWCATLYRKQQKARGEERQPS